MGIKKTGSNRRPYPDKGDSNAHDPIEPMQFYLKIILIHKFTVFKTSV
ncbi:hypothetical protein CPter91_1789 [Collimonas pratensis]|uniref:Uncharacterized protein n=1 Tax=Collimonas pratensis TaxID=279113 RepID=A0A127Q2A8_9BURK|nr:hypothetical protein CPter91_1789 [Collimonas pratensis]